MDTQIILENVIGKSKKEILLKVSGLRFYAEYFFTFGFVSFKNDPVSDVVLQSWS